jgi:Rap1a immunity proteins
VSSWGADRRQYEGVGTRVMRGEIRTCKISGMRTLIVSAALTLSSLSTAHCAAQKDDVIAPLDHGSQMFLDCKSGIKLIESVASGVRDKDMDIHGGERCANYFVGFTEAASFGNLLCFGNGTLGTMVRVYIAYMEAHPKIMDEPRAIGVQYALFDAYHCPIPTKPK